MKKMITLLALGVLLGTRALAQNTETPPAAAPETKPTASQVEQLNKQLDQMRKQLDATQAQIKALQDTNTSAGSPAVPSVPAPPVAPVPSVRPIPPAPPAPRVTNESVSRVGGNYTVGADEVVNDDARVIGGSLTVDGIVRGDASAVGGSLTINGEVDGDATVTGGSMILGPNAVVKGDVQCVGGSFQRDPGSRVDGDVKVRGGNNRINMMGESSSPEDAKNALSDGPFPIPLAILLAVVGLFLLTACPQRIDTIGRAFVNQPMYSLLIGVASIPLAIVLGIVSVITVVGPVLVTFGMVAAFFMGVIAVALMLGRRISLGKSYRSRFYPLVVGLGVWTLASAVSHSIAPALVLMSIASSVAFMMAIGAAIGTGWGKNAGWLKNKMEGNRGGTPWVDPNYTYAGSQDAYKNI